MQACTAALTCYRGPQGRRIQHFIAQGKHLSLPFYGTGSEVPSQSHTGNPGCLSRCGWRGLTSTQRNEFIISIPDNHLLLVTNQFASVFSYLFISASSLPFHFFQNPSFITLGVCTLCGQQHHCPAVIPLVVKASILK